MGTPSNTTQPIRHRHPLGIALALLSLLITPHARAQTTTINATAIPLILPSAIVFDPQGNLYIAETGNHIIRKVDTLGHITTIAGTGTQGYSGDSGPATAAQLDSPQGLALSTNVLYMADTHNHRIRKLDLATNLITTIAGTTAGFDGDTGPATKAHLNLPTAITFDANQNLYIADTANHRIRRIEATTGIITTNAGNGTQGFSGDSGPATAASIDSPTGLAVDTAGSLYLADTHNHRIRKITMTTGIITTIAGTGTLGQSGDTALANNAQLALLHGLTIDPQGNIYLADTANHRIRRIDATTGIITTIAGTGTQGYSGDASPATTATLDSPRTATLSPTNQVTLADTNNQRVRQLTTSPQTITTIAGLGNTTPGTLTLTAPSVIAYGTGQLTATLNTGATATGSITFLDTYAATTTTLTSTPLTTNTATLDATSLPAGTHIITATYPGDLTHTSAQSTAFTLTITPAPTLGTLPLPSSPATNPTTNTAQVASTTTGIPTGTLTLLDSTSPIGTATLTPAGTATFLIPNLNSGSHTLSAAYAGDPNFQPSTTAPATLTIANPITTPADFTLTATSPTSQTIPSGTTATFTFTASTQGNLSSPITLSASGLPLGAIATFNPTLIPPGATSPNFTLTITTLKLASTPTNKLAPTLATLLLPLLCLTSLRRHNRGKRLLPFYSIVLMSLITLTATACGARVNTANSQATAQPQTYTITITGTATTPTGTPLTHTAAVTLTLQ